MPRNIFPISTVFYTFGLSCSQWEIKGQVDHGKTEKKNVNLMLTTLELSLVFIEPTNFL